MSLDNAALRKSLQPAQRRADGVAPDFGGIFAAAEKQLRFRRRTWRAGLVAGIVLFALTFALLPSKENDFVHVDMEELLATTYWSAPSDYFLPKHQFDVYRELPRFHESTEPDEGTLL